MTLKIMVVEDEEIKRETIKDFLEEKGFNILAFDNPVSTLSNIGNFDPDIVVSDLRLPSFDGITLMKKAKEIKPSLDFIIMTAFASVDTAVEAMKQGAFDYIKKPFELEELLVIIERLIKIKELKSENLLLKEKLEDKYDCCNIVGKSKEMRAVYELIDSVSDSSCTVLIKGESGTGKELVANAIHYNSVRKNGPFIKINCSVFNPNLLESELFGHEKGAFTGAIREKSGKFELAHRGTIFLDDIDDMPFDLQVKLLRVLQEREIERVGGNKPISVDVRIVAATKVDLKAKVQKGEFREDLYYRINVVRIDLPPLKARKEDISLLFNFFLKKYCEREKVNFPEISGAALTPLFSYNWPGNVRELENFTERLVTLNKSVRAIDEKMVRSFMPENESSFFGDVISLINESKSFIEIIDLAEKALLKWALREGNGNKTAAANLLKMKRTTFCDKLLKHGMEE
ncbi:MAG: sigma-54-dependent Fis family transcriptional regulator [Candidatus Schekmanbacteria bacterium]|nr:sigma-54-dependent Fis family transcriptional regulator [Candidatus Schekmanbacteria bacterium]